MAVNNQVYETIRRDMTREDMNEFMITTMDKATEPADILAVGTNGEESVRRSYVEDGGEVEPYSQNNLADDLAELI